MRDSSAATDGSPNVSSTAQRSSITRYPLPQCAYNQRWLCPAWTQGMHEAPLCACRMQTCQIIYALQKRMMTACWHHWRE